MSFVLPSGANRSKGDFLGKGGKTGKARIPGGTRGSPSIADEAGISLTLSIPFQVFPGCDRSPLEQPEPLPNPCHLRLLKKPYPDIPPGKSFLLSPFEDLLSIFPLKFPLQEIPLFFARLEKSSEADGREESWKILENFLLMGQSEPRGSGGEILIPCRGRDVRSWMKVQYQGIARDRWIGCVSLWNAESFDPSELFQGFPFQLPLETSQYFHFALSKELRGRGI